MATRRRRRFWPQWHYVYEYPTDMGCAMGAACPRGGEHGLYAGISNSPRHRDGQHAVTQSWYDYRCGPQRVVAAYPTRRQAKRHETRLIRSGRYLANIEENEDNPCRFYFRPRVHSPAVPARRRLRRRHARRGDRLAVALAVFATALLLANWWPILTLGLLVMVAVILPRRRRR